MSKNTKSKLTREDPYTGKTEMWAELELPPNVELVSQRWTKEGWSGSFRYYGEGEFVVRERSRGTMECEWRPYNRVKRALGVPVRKRTGETRIDRALDEAIRQFIHPEHEKRVVAGPQLEKEESEGPAAIGNLSAEDLLILVLMLDLLHGNRKQRQKELKVLALMAAVFGSKPFAHYGKADIELLYEIRKKGFDWPARFSHRRRLSANPKPLTVQKEWETLATLLGRLTQEVNPETGKPYLSHNRIADLNLGNHARAQRPSAHPHRYAWVYRFADASVELVREHGIDTSYFTIGESGERKLHESRRGMENVVPGITRAMLVFQYGHGMRPGSWRHIRVEDHVALNTVQARRAIRSLRLAEYDERIPDQWARYWPYGAIVYRKEFLKGKANRRYERIVPLSEKMKKEVELYLERRQECLDELGVDSPWLFPNPTNPADPISDGDARDLLYAAEAMAREAAAEQRGDDYAEEVVPELDHTAWYAYRRAWKTLRNALGWHGSKNANYCGGWSTKVGQISEVVYGRLLPQYMLGVIEGLSVTEAVAKYGDAEEFRVAVDLSPEHLPPVLSDESLVA